jgi:hypothetical protein
MKTLLIQIVGIHDGVVAEVVSAGSAEGIIAALIADFNREVLDA